MLLEPNDVRTAVPDSKGQTLLSLDLSQGYDGVAETILEWGGSSSGTADSDGQTPFPPSPASGGEGAAEMQFTDNDSSVGTSDINGLPTLLSVDYNGQEVVLNSKDSVSTSADSGSSAEPSRLSQPHSIGPPKPPHPPKNTGINPNPSLSILPFAVHSRLLSPLLFVF